MDVRRFGFGLNVALRLGLVAMLLEVLRSRPDDHRFVDKGLGPRVLMVVPLASVAVPALWLRRRWGRGDYPVWMDNLYLSVFALDLGGNVLDLYDSYKHFDLIPHAHGGGAATIIAAWLLAMPMPAAIGAANVGHVLLEIQEYLGDVVFGTRNVRGAWDVVGDLGSGVVGSLAYGWAYETFVRRWGRAPLSLVAV